MDYPRLIVQFPGILRVVRTREEHQAIMRSELIATVVFSLVLAVGLAALLIFTVWRSIA